jgi:hypothetical protein
MTTELTLSLYHLCLGLALLLGGLGLAAELTQSLGARRLKVICERHRHRMDDCDRPIERSNERNVNTSTTTNVRTVCSFVLIDLFLRKKKPRHSKGGGGK